MDRIIELIRGAANTHGIPLIADELRKPAQTIRNDLNETGTHKLGLRDAVGIIEITRDLRPLDRIERRVGRVAFTVPKPEKRNMKPVMVMISRLTKEFSENMASLADAIEDGVVTQKEARQCLKENREMIEAGLLLQAYLEQYLKIKEV